MTTNPIAPPIAVRLAVVPASFLYTLGFMGGGAGGMILLEAPTVTVATTAKLLAGGGRGGGYKGGAGSASTANGANGGTDSADTLGGGGGGAGRIVIHSGDVAKNINLSSLTPASGNLHVARHADGAHSLMSCAAVVH
jgi:hypothetical protein